VKISKKDQKKEYISRVIYLFILMYWYLIPIILVIIFYIYAKKYDTHPVKSDIMKGDFRYWNVVGSYENKREAADMMNKVNHTMITFMRHLKQKYHIDETQDEIKNKGINRRFHINSQGDSYNIVDNLLDNYNPDVFYENDPRYSSETSYTLDKGSSLYICLRNKDDPHRLVDFDVLVFVMLHEISHIANYNGWGHDEQFWRVFKFILREAVQAGIYHPVDYKKYPIIYCGLKVDYNPYFDNSLSDV